MKRVMVVAGEESGDAHAARLIQAINQINEAPVEFFGLGGETMRKAGVELLVDARQLASIGPFETIPKLLNYYRCFRSLIHAAKARKPDLIILVDFAEFNLLLAGRLKKLGFKILYYISPQVWAWRKGRIKKIRQCVDKMVVILPFEKDFYRAHGVDVEYFGHPSVADLSVVDRGRFCAEFRLDERAKNVSLLPGSRRREVAFILPQMLGAAALMNSKIKINVLIAKANGLDDTMFTDIIRRSDSESLTLKIVEGRTRELLAVSDLALVKSGTSTLEALLTETPFIVVYRISWLSWLVGQLLIETPYYGLANLVAGERVVPELLQSDASPQNIARHALEILLDAATAEQIRSKLKETKTKLGEGAASYKAARFVSSVLNEGSLLNG